MLASTPAQTLNPIRSRRGIPRFSLFGKCSKGGAAIGNIKQEIGTLPGSDQTKGGWNAGVGAELMINRYWSAKAEYMRVSLGSASCDAPCGFVNTPLVENLFMVGVNYHLGQ